jgi:predicted N-acyltransferase
VKSQIFSRIDQIPKQLWNGLLSENSTAFSHEFWEVIERSGMNDFSYRHVVITDDNDTPVALTSFYSVTTDIAIFAPRPLRNLLTKVRRFFPNFLKFRMIEWGTPITVSSPPFIVAPGVSRESVVEHMHQLLMKTAKAEGQFLIIVRDLENGSEPLQKKFNQLGYHLVDSLPNTYLDVQWATTDAYHASMKSYYRSKLLKHLRRNRDQHVHHELVNDFDHLADVLCAQWMVVHDQADEFQREVLTPTFYRDYSNNMGTRSKALLFFKRDTLIGHALLLQDGSVLRWLYFGRNEAVNDGLYFYVAQSVIDTAIQLKASAIEMGLTTYSIKQDLGARIMPIKIAIQSPLKIINPFISLGYAALNRPNLPSNRQVFKPSV